MAEPWTPAEGYAAARRRQVADQAHPALSGFRGGYPFGLDDFQVRACAAVEDGHGVLVAAPTGSGKTVVGEFAVHLALRQRRKCFYTTPIKALSNQKYADLVARHGSASVGLLTGDNSVNGDAPVVVMTTEVLRNMLYGGSPALDGLGWVVMDEVHYLADRFRGPVWEEVIIHLPGDVRLVSLSATVSNAEEFADWLVTVRGHTAVVVSEHRPVPLWQHVMVGSRLLDLFDDEREVNPELLRMAREEARFPAAGRGRRWPPRSRYRVPGRVDVVETLDREGLLPAITFVFSRAGCDAAVAACLRSGLRLNTPEEQAAVRALVEERTRTLPPDDLAVLGYWELLEGLERGVAAHHAGMLPAFREVVEQLFVRGLVKAVFATETLALGINMPARSVVLERLVKWNGETHAPVTPGEYTQLTGRAGRRGIDVEGHGVVLWAPDLDPEQVAGLASTRTYPLRSSFRPTYNMAVNLVGQMGRERARALLELSFAQFQADRAVVGLARQVSRNTEALAGYVTSMTCHLGDFAEYAALRRRLTEREATVARERSVRRRVDARESLLRLRPGDVIRVPAGRRAGLAVVLDRGSDGDDDPRPSVLTEDRQVRRLSVQDFPVPVDPLGRVRVPRSFNPRSPQSRRDLAASVRALDLPPGRPANSGRGSRGARGEEDAEVTRLRRALREHPCHDCPDREEHARWSGRYDRLRHDTDALERRVEARTSNVAVTFDRVCAVLDRLGYLDGDRVTERGRLLAGLWTESDLLVAECLGTGDWDGLTPPELAAVVSSVLYEARAPDNTGAPGPLVPTRVRQALSAVVRRWAALEEVEAEHRLGTLRQPDPGFAAAAHGWAAGQRLDVVLTDADLSAGDFVRWSKQIVDLLGQVAEAPGDAPVASTARRAVTAMLRGVVAYSSLG